MVTGDSILDALEMDEESTEDNKGFFGVDGGGSDYGGSQDKKKLLDTATNSDDYYNQEAITLQDKKLEQEIKKLKIANSKELGKLVERNLVVAVFGEMSQSVQSHIVDQAKRKAKQWADLLGIPGKEREIEELIGDLGAEYVSGLISDIERFTNSSVWEK